MVGTVEMCVFCTWTMDAFAATAGSVEPTRADPATPSATIAGMMIARPMRMTPPRKSPGQWPGSPAVGHERPSACYFHELTVHAINLKEKIYIDIAMLAAAVIAQIYVLKGYLLLAVKLAQRPGENH